MKPPTATRVSTRPTSATHLAAKIKRRLSGLRAAALLLLARPSSWGGLRLVPTSAWPSWWVGSDEVPAFRLPPLTGVESTHSA